MVGSLDFTLVILSYNRKDDLRESLSRIYEYWTDKEIEVIVTDNNSTDGTQNMVTKEFPQVKLIKNKVNIGVKACNQAFKEAKGKYACIFDDDSFPHCNSLKKVKDIFENNPDVGIVAFNVKNYSEFHNQSNIDDKKELKIEKRDYLMGFNGAGAAFRKDVLNDVGAYAEEFFIYWNEADLALKFLDKGYKIVEVANIISFHKMSPTNRISTRAPFYYTRNLYWLIWKHFPLNLMIKYTFKLFYLCCYYSLEQGVLIYLKATFFAFINFYKAFSRRKKVKKKIAKSFRIAFHLPFTVYK